MTDRDGQPKRPSSAKGGAAPTRGPVAADPFTPELVEAVNHHLRTPLTAVLGHAELMLHQEHELPADVQQSLMCVVRAGRRLNHAVAGVCDLIDIARVDPNSVERVDVAALVADEVAACQGRAGQRGVRLWAGGDPEVAFVADSRRLRRAVHELVDNALNYAPDESSVRVVTTVGAAGVRIEVCDEGEGIDPADRERLLRPFERGTHPRQPTAGCGMGLALASAVAASHGGRLVLSAGPGRGLRVTLELPVDFTALKDAPAPPWVRAAAAWSRAWQRALSGRAGDVVDTHDDRKAGMERRASLTRSM